MSSQSFAQSLKGYREVIGISQSRLAEAAGFDHSYLSRLESGQRQPTREAVLRLAKELELSPVETDVLLMAAGFLPDGSAALYTYAEVAHLDRALVTCPDPQARQDALAAVRLLAKALGDTTLPPATLAKAQYRVDQPSPDPAFNQPMPPGLAEPDLSPREWRIREAQQLIWWLQQKTYVPDNLHARYMAENFVNTRMREETD